MNHKGFIYGLLSSASFGLIPLFTIPALKAGMGFNSILIYRFIFACFALLAILMMEKKSFKISKGEAARLSLLAILYDCSSLFLFWGYTFMSSGIATTIHFMYPVITALVMILFFKEKKSLTTFIAIALAVSGVVFLSQSDPTNSFSIWGLFIVLISALGYALYLITINQLNLREMGSLKMTFYVFLFGLILLLFISPFTKPITAIPSFAIGFNLFLLGLIPTVLSNIALIHAIKKIGSTLTSILGALEPLTAVTVGILFFNESFSLKIGLGITSIIAAVILLIMTKRKAH